MEKLYGINYNLMILKKHNRNLFYKRVDESHYAICDEHSCVFSSHYLSDIESFLDGYIRVLEDIENEL